MQQPNQGLDVADAQKADTPAADPWRSLYRKLPGDVYHDWQEVERMVAAKFGINLGGKHETPGAWAELYERMCQHFLQMDDKSWRNF